MRKFLQIAGLFVAGIMCSCLIVGCGGAETGVKMNYADGGKQNTTLYDRDMFFKNANETSIADPGVIYVSEEESKEYGGWYYMYSTGASGNLGGELYAFQCYRSKNLSEWSLAGGYEQGYSLKVTPEDWMSLDEVTQWAPEVIRNPKDGKYYMYFSASARPATTVSGDGENFDRLYLGIAVGDTPLSFRILGAEKAVFDADKRLVTNERPPIDFQRAYGLTDVFSVIDASPFLDDDGTLYLYFNKHTDRNPETPGLMGTWGIRMRDFVTPDYQSLKAVTMPNVVSVEGGLVEGKPKVVSLGDKYSFSEGSINEAPFMVKHNGRYYLTYSGNGYRNPAYSVHQAISDKPLGDFVKPLITDGNPVLASYVPYVSGTGHHCIVKTGEDYVIVYARMANPDLYGLGWTRIVGIDNLVFTKNGKGEEVLTSNGPSYSLQPLPEAISGYHNYAKDAAITVSGGEGGKYLKDGIVPYYNFSADWYWKGETGASVTFEWNKPVPLSAVMIYNTKEYDYAFKNIKSIRLYFAEKPSWASKEYTYGSIQNIPFPDELIYETAIMWGSACVAQFESVKVNKIVITLGEKYEEFDAFGNPSSEIRIPEIVCLGKEG